MDKKLMLAVAGAGKTTFIVDTLENYHRTLVITYTDANYNNLLSKIREKNNGVIPEEISVFTYFTFLYQFCYKPFLSDAFPAKGINYKPNSNRRLSSNNSLYYRDTSKRLYSNRISFLLEKAKIIENVKRRIEKYFDLFVVDEVQDISGRDFNFVEKIIQADVDILFVGDFYQHTYNTSADGNTNKSLFNSYNEYVKRFENNGLLLDDTTLLKSWRCGEQVCQFVRDKLKIEIYSNKDITGSVVLVQDIEEIREIWLNPDIVKLHYQKASEYGSNHRNWGETKGEDCYQDVCIILNKTTMEKYKKNKLSELATLTKNKLYVAITRAKGNVYFVDSEKIKQL